jgi:hypothetical protein
LGNIQRVSDSSLSQQFTAKRLIGQDVYDNSNKKIGEIKDVVLDASGAQQLASAMSAASSDNVSSSTSSADRTHSGVGASGSAGASTTGAGASGSVSAGGATASGTIGAGSGASGSLGASSGSNGIGSPTLPGGSVFAGLGSSSEPSVIVSFGGFMGVGGNSLRVPLSQLNYDSSSRHIKLNISQEQLSNLTSTSERSRSAAE